jgi:hypothetical protein
MLDRACNAALRYECRSADVRECQTSARVTEETVNYGRLRSQMRPTRPSAHTPLYWYVLPLGVLILFAGASRTPYFLLFRLLFTTLLVVLCALDWRSKRRGLLPILSWSVPFASLWVVAQIVFDKPAIAAILTYSIGGLALVPMVVSNRAARWWYETVLRQRFRG